MYNSTRLICMALICMFTFSSCSKDSVIPEESAANLSTLKLVDNFAYSKIETQILDAVNAHRQSIGLSSLSPVDDITLQALDHTSYMATQKVVNHDDFNKRYEALVKEIGAKAVAENVAFGYRTADAVVAAWIKSDEHRANLEGDYKYFGVAVEQDKDGRNYFTNIFVR